MLLAPVHRFEIIGIQPIKMPSVDKRSGPGIAVKISEHVVISMHIDYIGMFDFTAHLHQLYAPKAE